MNVARWLVEQGARHLVLTGRSGAARPEAQAAVKELEAAGVTVQVVKADVSRHDDVVQLLAEMTDLPPLRGVVHAAGVAEYQTLPEIDLETFEAVLKPKVLGGWHLHNLTKDLALDFFVLFSSIASVWGSKGQAHYAAANQFLDALAEHRRREGLPVLAINWGPWAGGGMVTTEAASLLARMGVNALSPADGLAALEYLLAADLTQALVAQIDWSIFKSLYQAGSQRPLLEQIEAESSGDASPEQPSQIRQTLAEAASHTRYDLLLTHIQTETAAILGLEAAQLPDPRLGFADMGMDSLMAVELRTRLAAGLGVDLPATLAFEYPTIDQLTTYLAEGVLNWAADEPEAESATDGAGDQTETVLEISQLSEAELDEAMAQELAELQALLGDD